MYVWSMYVAYYYARVIKETGEACFTTFYFAFPLRVCKKMIIVKVLSFSPLFGMIAVDDYDWVPFALHFV